MSEQAQEVPPAELPEDATDVEASAELARRLFMSGE